VTTSTTTTVTTKSAAGGTGTPKLTERVETWVELSVDSCEQAKKLALDSTLKAKLIKTMADQLGLSVKDVDAVLKQQCPDPRRLQAGRKLASYAVIAEYVITVPPGKTADSVKNSVTSAQMAAFTRNLKKNLASTSLANVTLTVTAIAVPVTSVGITGYTCKTGEACYFGKYRMDTHFTINSQTAVTLSECGRRCNAEAGCEAFEHNAASHLSTCSFWKAGACNIPGGNPPGYVKNVANVNTCEKDSAKRGAFTQVSSKCGRRSSVPVLSALTWAFLMSLMTK